jgi:mannosyltransferase OCH1-like enzyme
MLANFITLCILLMTHHAQAQLNSTFPKILWVYWEQDFNNAPSFTQLSIQNKERFAAESGWEVRFLTEKSIKEYIEVGEIEALMALADDKQVQLKVDILCMMLIYRYGGLWMDANSFFLRPLEWL